MIPNWRVASPGWRWRRRRRRRRRRQWRRSRRWSRSPQVKSCVFRVWRIFKVDPGTKEKKRGSSIPGPIRTSTDRFVQTISKCFLRQTVQLTELLCSVSSEFSTDPREKAIKVFNCWGWTNENKIETSSSSSSSHLKTHITLKPFWLRSDREKSF